MTEYLLGLLSDEECEQIEQSFLEDDAQFEQLTALEDDLIDSYVRGRLAVRLRKAFEQKLRSDPAWKTRVVFAQALARRIVLPQEQAQSTRRPSSFWEFLITAFRNQRPVFQLAAMACSVLILVAVSGVVWQVEVQRRTLLGLQSQRDNLQNSVQSLEAQIAELRGRDADLSAELERERVRRQELESRQQTPVNPLGLVASFVLRSGTVRGTSETTRFVIPRAARTVRLQLDLDTVGEYRSYRAELRTTRGDVVWSGDRLRARNVEAGEVLMIELPAQFINSGEYELALSGLNQSGRFEEAAFYYFSVPE